MISVTEMYLIKFPRTTNIMFKMECFIFSQAIFRSDQYLYDTIFTCFIWFVSLHADVSKDFHKIFTTRYSGKNNAQSKCYNKKKLNKKLHLCNSSLTSKVQNTSAGRRRESNHNCTKAYKITFC